MRSYIGSLNADRGSTRATSKTFDKGLGYRSMIPEADAAITTLTGVDSTGASIDFKTKYNLSSMKEGYLYTVAADEIILVIDSDEVVVCY